MKRILIIGILVLLGWAFKSNTFSIVESDNNFIEDTYVSPVDTISDEEIDAIMNDDSDYSDKLYRHISTKKEPIEKKFKKPIIAKRKQATKRKQTTKKNKFKCDKRKHCSQMRSYEEAKYFLSHCPGVKMDGDGDGIPCERQFGKYY